MINLAPLHYFEIAFWLSSIWIGIYLVSRDPYSKLSWVAAAILFCFGLYVGIDPIYNIQHLTLQNYIVLQKIFDPTLFFSPILCYHATLLVKQTITKFDRISLWAGYLVMIIVVVLDSSGGYVVKEGLFRDISPDYNFLFKPGPILLPLISLISVYLLKSLHNITSRMKDDFWKYSLFAFGIIVYLVTDIFYGASYYYKIDHSIAIANVLTGIGTFLIIFSIVKYHLFVGAGKIIFDRTFLYVTISMAMVLAAYIICFFALGFVLDYKVLLFLNVLSFLLLLTHLSFSWLQTFINDLVYNTQSGFSVVTDEEVYQAIRSYNSPAQLEENSLLRLKVVAKVAKNEEISSVDALRKLLKEAIEYYRPEESSIRRIKRNLKYYLLCMISYDQAEEGQILWELGFDEYPTKIITQENRGRKPLFGIESASDYSYTSRNAYLALKKEAIHDITWRISYLEKLARSCIKR